MYGTATAYTWMTRMARRIFSSSGSPLAPPKASPCLLDLLGHARPQAHPAAEPNI
jgi:hypothetical protein